MIKANSGRVLVNARIASYCTADTTAPMVHYEAAKAALAEAVRIDDVKAIRDKAEAIRLYALQAKNQDLHIYATKIKLRAERRAGELSKQLEKLKPEESGGMWSGLPSSGKTSKAATLKEAGISTSQANRYEKLAAIDDGVFEQALDQCTKARPNASTDFLLRLAEEMKPWDEAEQFVRDHKPGIDRHQREPRVQTARHWSRILASLKGLAQAIQGRSPDVSEPLDDYETLRALWSIVRPYLDEHLENT